MAYRTLRLQPGNLELVHGLLTMFGEAFEDVATYGAKRPSAKYLDELLAGSSFVALVALQDDVVVGGLTAYELRKYEQERSEFYIYDLAVSATHRRQGIATALIHAISAVAKQRGAWVTFVQADLVDDPAIALYTKLGIREDVLHFDIPVDGKRPSASD